MNNNPNQPREYDAVLGGDAPDSRAVLGGIAGVKSRLKSGVFELQVAALTDALNYGNAGLDLVIDALQDSSHKIHKIAVELLQQTEGKGKQALLGYQPGLFFTTLNDWTAEKFNPETGITNPSETAYIVNIEQLKLLLQDPQVSQIEALICHLTECDYLYRVTVKEQFDIYVELLFEARHQLTNLKALFIGEYWEHLYKKDDIGLGDITLILKGYPHLEVLQLYGCCNELECEKLQHNNLKTLIVETTHISDVAIYRLCSLNLPALEYFELWMGRTSEHSYDDTIDSLKPILFSESFPNLKYLGLHSDYADAIADAIAQSSFMAESPILATLEVLDLSMGNLTDTGLNALIESEAIINLHTLNIAHNYISEEFIQEIKELSLIDCLLIAHSQENRSYGHIPSRYSALYE
ncbi:MAG: HEAT repeat domain-containing protein [Nostoc sp. GBBB01]|uniref:HEAT repeat domain-containing protein n=1 Tax=Nostoc punctiforme FACHB-252 TaxID=1357509 RepID=A0ABR8HEK3_NOSPU|nr:HEAT repeat domain-containing protein [Nostoc punctiforme]MBD2613615.1 HEAT repeat domain-containing protein [Nostoc punctiforme FACHB-252]MBL1199719.1 HEAT repeat domain-containing protein [Nostoc sp. GBBB01]